MPNHLSIWREQAFERQSGRCFYCGHPMCNADIRKFAVGHGISARQAKLLRCTAEHLHARRDGGRDCPANIVAACLTCNTRRHARPTPLKPEPYRRLIQTRLAQGRWHVHIARPNAAFNWTPTGGPSGPAGGAG